MTLALSILRGPTGVATETRRVTSGTLSIGRGPGNDWVLPDPGRALSKRHCVIARAGEGWQATDTSSNGTFLNDEGEALGNGASRLLRDGDRLLLGSYEIGAEMWPETDDEPLPDAGFGPAATPSPERLPGDPFAPLEHDPLGISLPSSALPSEFGATRPDHVSIAAAEFRPPRPSLELLPQDWDAEIPQATSPAPPEPPPPPTLGADAGEAGVSGAGAGRSRPGSRPKDGPVPDFAAFAAFAAGAGLSGPVPADPDALLRSVGAAFRAVVSGLRQAMMARATIKSEFRIDQTMMQAAGNNPLKFSADDDDALAGLLGIGRRATMSAEAAVGEAMRDLRLHELAMASAIQRAARDLLATLAPTEAATRAGPSRLDVLPGRRAARQWRAYEAQHRAVAQALSDDLDGAFGRSFMRAYEDAMRDAAAQAPAPPGRGVPQAGKTSSCLEFTP